MNYQDYLDGTRQILLESQKETRPYQTTVAGRKFVVLPNVFSPKYFRDTEEFAQHLPVSAGESMLEIGPGTGAIAITAIYQGAQRVVATDINPAAVKNTEINIVQHCMGNQVEVRQGDVYSAVRSGERFDTIFWNTPFGLVENQNLSDLEKAVYDPGYKATERFITEAPLYLKPGGRLLIGFSSTLGRMDLLEQLLKKAGFTWRLVYEVSSEEVHPVQFEIFEAHQR